MGASCQSLPPWLLQHADAAGPPEGQLFLPDVPELITSSELRASRDIYSSLELCVFCWKAKSCHRNGKYRQKSLSPSRATLYQETLSGPQQARLAAAVMMSCAQAH